MTRRSTLLLTLLCLAACQRGQPCPTCEDGAADEPAEVGDEVPDLPCGGADLLSADLDCGECGNVCTVRGKGLYETAGCVEGACAATWWGVPWPEPPYPSCAEFCQMVDPSLSCDPNACVGLTAMVCELIANNACGVISGANNRTLVDFEGGCEDEVPWPEETEFGGVPQLYCCCG